MAAEGKTYTLGEDLETLQTWLGASKPTEGETKPKPKSKPKEDSALESTEDNGAASTTDETVKAEASDTKETKKKAKAPAAVESHIPQASKKAKKEKEAIETDDVIEARVSIAKSKVITEVEKAAQAIQARKIQEAEEKRRQQEVESEEEDEDDDGMDQGEWECHECNECIADDYAKETYVCPGCRTPVCIEDAPMDPCVQTVRMNGNVPLIAVYLNNCK